METQTNLDIENIFETATDFEVSEYPIVKKENLENEVFFIFGIKEVTVEKKPYFNFQAVTPSKEPFCFNGGAILRSQLDGIKLPVKVKLVKVELGDKAKKGQTDFYWSFAKP